jgi:hypothetical protein
MRPQGAGKIDSEGPEGVAICAAAEDTYLNMGPVT